MRAAKGTLTAMLAAVALGLSISASAHPDADDCGGPGMMGGFGQGHGMGPGMMGGGYGMGPGMMGGGYGMGPGMMGGGSGMGPGMMGGGYGRGYGMGPWASGSYGGLDLNADQRAKIAKIQQDLRTRHWALMGKMMNARFKLEELYDTDKPDAAAISQQYKEIDDTRRQMIDASIDARNQSSGVLTKEQKDKLGESTRGWRHGMGMMWGG
jgi:Spy/CpxP family protein refolding chaperone